MVSEKKIFENGGRRRTTDGRTPDHGHPISSPCEPNGSGELKTIIYICINAETKSYYLNQLMKDDSYACLLVINSGIVIFCLLFPLLLFIPATS